RALGARPKTSWVAKRTRACGVGITRGRRAAAGEASAANLHVLPPSWPAGFGSLTCPARFAAPASPAAALRSRAHAAHILALRPKTKSWVGLLGARPKTSWVAGTDASMWRSRHARPPCRGWRSQRGTTDTRRSRGLAALMFIGCRLGLSAVAVAPRVFV